MEKSSKRDACARVPLDVYAHVRAALAEEFRLREILDLEGVAPEDWAAADLAWKRMLTADAKELARFEQELILAEDWLDRDVAPLREDVAAWTAFLDTYLSNPSRFDFVTGLGLRMSDVARLQRRWALRMKADRAIERQAAELRRKPMVLPAVQVAESTLKRSRNAKPVAGAPVTTAPAPTASAPTPREVRGVDLNRFASITAEIRANPGTIEATLRRHGLAGESAYREIECAFHNHFAADAEVARDYHRLLAHHDGRLRVAGTSLSLDVPRGPALPFVAPPFSEPSASAATAPRGSTQGAVVASGTAPMGTGTMLTLDVPHVPPPLADIPVLLPGLTVDQYAWLTATFRRTAPADLPAVLARVRLTPETRKELEARWSSRMAADPHLKETFLLLLARHLGGPAR